MTIESVVAQDDRPPVLRGPGTWSLTWSGVRTVAVLELRQRVRSSRWVALLVAWGLAIAGLSGLIRFAAFALTRNNHGQAGATMFGAIIFTVLSLGALISPALSATSINGDRTAGVLATMQSTLLSPAEIAVGKLLAAWTASLALLVTSLPFVLWAYLEGGTPAGRLVVTVLVTALTLLVVCAIGLGFSSLTARTSSSTALTYLTVAFLTLGLPIVFGLSLTMTEQEDSVIVRTSVPADDDPNSFRCVDQRQLERRTHTEATWWLLAPSPFVIVSDAAPTRTAYQDDPLSVIRQAVREARLGPTDRVNYCDGPSSEQEQDRAQERNDLPAAWPYGLAADGVLTLAFVTLAVSRLRSPSRKLPRGSRIA